MDCVLVTGSESPGILQGLIGELGRVGTKSAVLAIEWHDRARAPYHSFLASVRGACRSAVPKGSGATLVPGHLVSLSCKADFLALVQELRRDAQFREEVCIVRLSDPLLIEEKGVSLLPLVAQVKHLVVLLDSVPAGCLHIPTRKFPKKHVSFAISYVPIVKGGPALLSSKDLLRELQQHLLLPLKAQLLCFYLRPIESEMLLLRSQHDITALIAVLLGTSANLLSFNTHVLRQIKRSAVIERDCLHLMDRVPRKRPREEPHRPPRDDASDESLVLIED